MAEAADTLAKVRDRLEKKYKDSNELFPDLTSVRKISKIPTRSSIINAVTGIGGIPRGRMTEIHGPFSTGKTTICVETMIQMQQRENANILFLDFEHALDPAYSHALGLDLGRLLYAQPTYFEQGAQIALDYLDTGLMDMVVIDSAAAMTPKAELEGEIDKDGGTTKGLQAALMARFLMQAVGKIARYRKPALLMTNQTRAYIDIGGRPKRNAPKEVPAGGNALRFYSSIRLSLEILHPEGDENRGTKGTDQVYTQNRIRVTCTKNKLAPPYMRGTFVMEYGKGTNDILSIAELAEAKLGIMSGAGFFKYEGDTTETSFSCRGRDAFADRLANDPATRKEIRNKVLAAIKQEHAAALGITELKESGEAKEIEPENGPALTTLPNGEDAAGLLVEDLE